MTVVRFLSQGWGMGVSCVWTGRSSCLAPIRVRCRFRMLLCCIAQEDGGEPSGARQLCLYPSAPTTFVPNANQRGVEPSHAGGIGPPRADQEPDRGAPAHDPLPGSKAGGLEVGQRVCPPEALEPFVTCQEARTLFCAVGKVQSDLKVSDTCGVCYIPSVG